MFTDATKAPIAAHATHATHATHTWHTWHPTFTHASHSSHASHRILVRRSVLFVLVNPLKGVGQHTLPVSPFQDKQRLPYRNWSSRSALSCSPSTALASIPPSAPSSEARIPHPARCGSSCCSQRRSRHRALVRRGRWSSWCRSGR